MDLLITLIWYQSGNTIADNDVKTTNVKCNSTIFGVEGKCTLYEKVASESLGTDKANGIKYDEISSDTNGKGVYTIDNVGVYFYRGEVDNNHVLFNNICWRIVRTTSTGGVKLIYDGLPNEGKCNNTGVETQLDAEGSKFNEDRIKPEYVGWKYTEGEYHGTDTPSTIYGVVQSWYTNNMESVQNKLESTVWCSDRRAYLATSAIPGEDGVMSYNVSAHVSYAPSIKSFTLKSPSLECPNSADQFPGYFGLITGDEVMYAGGVSAINTSYYLNTGNVYCTMSPQTFNINGHALILVVSEVGWFGSNYVDSYCGVRPMVSLNSSATISSGDGSSGTPYIVN